MDTFYNVPQLFALWQRGEQILQDAEAKAEAERQLKVLERRAAARAAFDRLERGLLASGMPAIALAHSNLAAQRRAADTDDDPRGPEPWSHVLVLELEGMAPVYIHAHFAYAHGSGAEADGAWSLHYYSVRNVHLEIPTLDLALAHAQRAYSEEQRRIDEAEKADI